MQTIIHTDVVVLGGGPSGVAAAVAASKAGLKVALIERNSFLGGHATASEVGTICGLYKFKKDEYPEYIVGGFAKKFAEDIKTKSGTAPLHNSAGLHYLPYDVNMFKKQCIDLLEENKVSIFFGAEPYSIQRDDALIESITITAAGGPVQFQLRAIIDCSGNSLLSQLADLPVIKSEKYQAAAQVFTLKNIREHNEATLGMVLMKELRSAIIEKKLPHYFDRVYIVPGSLKNNCANFKIGIPLPVTHTPENLLALKANAHSFVHELTEYLTSQVAFFKGVCLSGMAPEIGIRVGMRTMGKYILTEEDVLQCKKFDDAIANAPWPIEEWEQDRRVKMRYFKEDDFYQVPARCLQSITIANLFMAGKCISATDSAIASARVIGICLQTGYAAGYLAAASATKSAHRDAIKNIQDQEFNCAIKSLLIS